MKLSFILSLATLLYSITMLLYYNHTLYVCIAVAVVLLIAIPTLFATYKDKEEK